MMCWQEFNRVALQAIPRKMAPWNLGVQCFFLAITMTVRTSFTQVDLKQISKLSLLNKVLLKMGMYSNVFHTIFCED